MLIDENALDLKGVLSERDKKCQNQLRGSTIAPLKHVARTEQGTEQEYIEARMRDDEINQRKRLQHIEYNC